MRLDLIIFHERAMYFSQNLNHELVQSFVNCVPGDCFMKNIFLNGQISLKLFVNYCGNVLSLTPWTIAKNSWSTVDASAES